MPKVRATFPPGSIIQGRYVVEGILGTGRSSAAYLVRDQRAWDVQGNRFLLKEMVEANKLARHRLVTAGKLLRRVPHPALPCVRQVLNDDKNNRVYLLMDYIEGSSLEEALQLQPEQRFSLPEALNLIAPIMDAIIHLHSQHPHLIFGHIKPSNIIESTDASTILVGFDFEKEYDAEKTIAIAPGAKFGYEAPEHFIGVIGPGTDIYALGATLYTLLTGTIPAGALYRLKKLSKKELDPLVPLNQLAPAVPEPVGEVIHCAMSMSSDDRFSSVEQFWEALQQASNTSPVVQLTTEPAVAAPNEEKTESETHSPGQQALEPSAGIEEASTLTTYPTIHQPPEPAAVSSDSPHTPVTSGTVKSRITRPLQETVQVRRFQKYGMLFLTLFALLVTLLGSVGVGASLWFDITSQHNLTFVAPLSGSQLPGQSPHPKVSSQPTVTATPVPVSSLFPNLSKLYTGTMYDIPAAVTTKISLTSIQQQQGNVNGYFSMPGNNLFSEIPRSGPFQGTINTAKEIQFSLIDDTGQPTAFNGVMQSDGKLAGTYCSLEVAAGKCGDYGLWSVSPST